MAPRIAKFEKVTYDQFRKDWLDTFDKYSLTNELAIHTAYDELALPVRATIGSNGYDFVSPLDFRLEPGEDIKIPTGIRCIMDEDWGLFIIPRSGLGFKYYMRTANLVADIDADFSKSENQGHIFIKVRNDGTKPMELKRGDRFVQGVFLPYGITVDDEVTAERNGGMGSTGA